jgi:GTP-binding protein HflX
LGKLHETKAPPKRAFLVSLRDNKISKNQAESLSRELAALVSTLELNIIAREIVTVRGRLPKFGMGSGKAAELAEKAAELHADCFVFDWNPGPSQQRNWEDLSGIPVVDRQELIIRIFAERAKTREAELQVRLAELNYALPRLTHKYIDLSRQRGGRYGTRGAGETRLEADRRLIEKRIYSLKGELEQIRRQRNVQRRARERQGIPVCSIVGYTNAGKSSLLNALTGADILAEDKLFVTLDATSRRLELPDTGGSAGGGKKTILLVDTVGFIRGLPHSLVDAFHSTLEETTLSDLIIHVVDISEADAEEFYETTLKVLAELHAEKIPRITVLNKLDKLNFRTNKDEIEPDMLEIMRRRCPDSIPFSVKTRSGFEELIFMIKNFLFSHKSIAII